MTKKERYVRLADSIHDGAYDYTATIFNSITHNITVNCPLHGDFTVKASAHVNSAKGCPYCEDDKDVVVIPIEVLNSVLGDD
jgi:hypothetical protein